MWVLYSYHYILFNYFRIITYRFDEKQLESSFFHDNFQYQLSAFDGRVSGVEYLKISQYYKNIIGIHMKPIIILWVENGYFLPKGLKCINLVQ